MTNDTQTGAESTASSSASEKSQTPGSSDGASRAASDGGKKWDKGKSPVFQGLFQYFPNALKAISDVSKYGAEKYKLEYSDVNWARVEGGLERYADALSRHLLDHFSSSTDPESGLLHIAHAAWNALAVLELTLRNKDGTKNNS